MHEINVKRRISIFTRKKSKREILDFIQQNLKICERFFFSIGNEKHIKYLMLSLSNIYLSTLALAKELSFMSLNIFFSFMLYAAHSRADRGYLGTQYKNISFPLTYLRSPYAKFWRYSVLSGGTQRRNIVFSLSFYCYQSEEIENIIHCIFSSGN